MDVIPEIPEGIDKREWLAQLKARQETHPEVPEVLTQPMVETQVPRRRMPVGSVKVGDGRWLCRHVEPHVIYEAYPRGPLKNKIGARGFQLPEPRPTGRELEELLAPYVLVVKRLAREKWIGFTREELLAFRGLGSNEMIHRLLFGGLSKDQCDLRFVPENYVDTLLDARTSLWLSYRSEVRPQENPSDRASVWAERLWKDDGRRHTWLVWRNMRDSLGPIIVRDGWDIDHPKRWRIEADFESGYDEKVRTTALNMRRRAVAAGEAVPTRMQIYHEARRLTDEMPVKTYNTMASLDRIICALFPKDFAAKRRFYIQVDRYKGEYIGYRPSDYPTEWGSVKERDATRRETPEEREARAQREAFLRNVLWRIDDPVINIYPAGRPTDETYEEFIERKKAFAASRPTDEQLQETGGLQQPAPTTGETLQGAAASSAGKPATEHPDPEKPASGERGSGKSDSDKASSKKSSEEPPALPAALEHRLRNQATSVLHTNSLICREHKACRALKHAMTPEEQEEHEHMHGDEECPRDLCHAWLRLLNADELQRHDAMHAIMAGKDREYPDEYEVNALDAADWKVCRRHEECHARLNVMDRTDRRWHDHMHTARRCKMHVLCHTPLDVLDGVQLAEHLRMHMDQGYEEDADLLLTYLESPGIFEQLEREQDVHGLPEILRNKRSESEDGDDDRPGDGHTPGSQKGAEKGRKEVSWQSQSKAELLQYYRGLEAEAAADLVREIVSKTPAPKISTQTTSSSGSQSKPRSKSKSPSRRSKTPRPPKSKSKQGTSEDTKPKSSKKGKTSGRDELYKPGDTRDDLDNDDDRQEETQARDVLREQIALEAEKWAAGWEYGTETKDGANKFEHCATCDKWLGALNGEEARKKHMDNCGNPETRWKTYKAGKQAKSGTAATKRPASDDKPAPTGKRPKREQKGKK